MSRFKKLLKKKSFLCQKDTQFGCTLEGTLSQKLEMKNCSEKNMTKFNDMHHVCEHDRTYKVYDLCDRYYLSDIYTYMIYTYPL